MPTSDRIRIDAPRFWSTVMRSGQIGPGKAGGLRRLDTAPPYGASNDVYVKPPTAFFVDAAPSAARVRARAA